MMDSLGLKNCLPIYMRVLELINFLLVSEHTLPTAYEISDISDVTSKNLIPTD